MKFNKTLIATACGLVAASAMAADVTLYGVLDQAVTFTGAEGNGTSTTLTSGFRWGSRVGLSITEELTPNVKVVGKLESGFNSDTGMMNERRKLFNRESTLGLSTTYGDIKFGRGVAITSGIDPKSFLSKYTAFGTSFGILSASSVVGNDPAFISNMVRYDSPALYNVNVSLQYSNGDDNEVGKACSDNRFYAATFDFKPTDSFSLGGGVEHRRLNGTDTVYGAAQDPTRFFVGVKGSYSNFNAYLTWVHSKNANAEVSGVPVHHVLRDADGDAFLLGGDWTAGSHKVMVGVGYSDADGTYPNHNYTAKAYQAGAGYEYSFSKRTTAYVTGGWLKQKVRDNGLSDNRNYYQGAVGVTHLF